MPSVRVDDPAAPGVGYVGAGLLCHCPVEVLHSYFALEPARCVPPTELLQAECRVRVNDALASGPHASRVLGLSVLGVSPRANDLIGRLAQGGLSATVERNYVAFIQETATFRCELRELRPKLRIPTPRSGVAHLMAAVRAGQIFYLGILVTTTRPEAGSHPDFCEFGLRRLVLTLPGGACVAIAPVRRVDHLETQAHPRRGRS